MTPLLPLATPMYPRRIWLYLVIKFKNHVKQATNHYKQIAGYWFKDKHKVAQNKFYQSESDSIMSAKTLLSN